MSEKWSVARSIAFVEEHGTDLEKVRLSHILHGAEPGLDAVESLVRLQNNDGGFPCRMMQDDPSTVNSTLTALWWLDELGMLGSTVADRSLSYLLLIQKEDGGWDEDPLIARYYEPPPWVKSGDLRTRLYLSAYSVYWLALGGRRDNPALRKGLKFLLKHQDNLDGFCGPHHTTWIATSAFIMAGPRYITAVKRGLKVLEDRPLSEWPDSQIAWALCCLGRAGLPEDRPFVKASLVELHSRRKPDGSWLSEDGQAHTVDATIEALKAFKVYALC